MSKRALIAILLVAAAVVLVGIVFAAQEESNAGSILYTCDCGAHCKCNTVSTRPGKCRCGEDLVPMHVLKIEGDEAILCRCGKDCACKLNAKDPSKCGCGKPVKRVNIKGMYVCGCGPDCSCNTVADRPGKCKCGRDLKKN